MYTVRIQRHRLNFFTRIFVKKKNLATSYSAALTCVVDNNCKQIGYFWQYRDVNILGMSVCLYPINVKTAEPIRAIFCGNILDPMGRAMDIVKEKSPKYNE